MFSSFVFSFLIFGTYFIIKEYLNPDAEVRALLAENRNLTNRLQSYVEKFRQFEREFDYLVRTNNDLRLAANLEPYKEEDYVIGMGGRIFDDINPSSSDDINELVNVLETNTERIKLRIDFEKENYKEIENTLNYNSKLFEALPAIKPTSGRYGDKFGMRKHPILKIRRMHTGLDIIANIGTPVHAPGSGTVEYAGFKSGYGKTIVINHGFSYKTVYGHLSGYKVKVGQKISRGDLIGYTGNSGRLSTGPHLHYEVLHNGIALDPRNFIFDEVKVFELNNEAEFFEE